MRRVAIHRTAMRRIAMHRTAMLRVAMRRAALRRTARRRITWLIILPFVAVGLLLGRPLPEAARRDPPTRPAVLDREGRLLRLAAQPDAGDCARAPLLTPETLPEDLVHATLAAEDRRFFRHPGLDPIGVARATLLNLRARRIVAGGSTLSQQLAGLMVTRRRTLAGKLAELDLAIRLELACSKREILAAYLNRAPYGNGCLGVTAAADHYFACTPAQLTTAEAALLSGLPRAPAMLDPRREPARARARAHHVLQRMHHLGWLDEGDLERALAEPLDLASRPVTFDAPHAVDWVLPALPAGAGSTRLTIDRDLTSRLGDVLAESLSPRRIDAPPHGAVVALEHTSGEILAVVGSPAYNDPRGGQWNAALAPRQPGSALKPFTYALAFADGHTPADLVADIPTAFLSLTGDYLPRNFNQTFHGPVRLREALASSYNVSAVRVLDEVGSARLLDLLHAAGVTTLRAPAADYGLGLTLGVGEVTLLDLCRAYAIFPRRGRALPITLIAEVRDTRGRRLPAPPAPEGLGLRTEVPLEPLLPERAAFWVADILADPEARIPAFGAHGPLELPFPVAAKTGTSSDFRDAWTVGFDDRYVVGVWIGNLDGEPLARLSGARAAAPLFREAWYALRAWEAARSAAGSGGEGAAGSVAGAAGVGAEIHGHAQKSEGEAGGMVLDPPVELIRRSICALSGQAPATACTEVVSEWLLTDAPLAPCRLHRRAGGGIETVLPAEYEPWLRRAGWQARIAGAGDGDVRDGGVRDGDVRGGGARDGGARYGGAGNGDTGFSPARFRIESPRDGERFYLAHDLPAEVQTIALRASGSAPAAVLTWEVDGVTAGTGTDVRWTLRPGAHRIAARAGSSRTAPVRIDVLESAP